MDINFEYYKVFYYVAKYGNLTKAAAAMRSSQPNITRIMKLLEESLQCRLLVREARGISLTEEGKRLYSHVEIAFNQLQNAQEEISAHASDGTGTIEIGATETALHLFLLDALQEFREIYPKVRMKIHNHTTLEILKSLAGGRLDVAVVTTPFDVSGQFVCDELTEFKEILVGSHQYSMLGSEKQDFDNLKPHPWVGLGTGTVTYEWYRDFFLENHIEIEPDTEAATSDLLIPLILGNMGIGFVPERMALSWLQERKLVRIPLNHEPPLRKICLVSDKGRGISAISAELQKYLKGRREYI